MVGGDPCAEGLDFRALDLPDGSYTMTIGGVLADGTLCWGDQNSAAPKLADVRFNWDGVGADISIPHDSNCPGI
jgi:hypothetical protein